MISYETVGDPVADHLLTPQNAALHLIDFQPAQEHSFASMEKRTLVANVTAVARTARRSGLPIVLTAVSVSTGRNELTIDQLREVLSDVKAIDHFSTWRSLRFS
jgi:nicotinamidase-related amidase